MAYLFWSPVAKLISVDQPTTTLQLSMFRTTKKFACFWRLLSEVVNYIFYVFLINITFLFCFPGCWKRRLLDWAWKKNGIIGEWTRNCYLLFHKTKNLIRWYQQLDSEQAASQEEANMADEGLVLVPIKLLLHEPNLSLYSFTPLADYFRRRIWSKWSWDHQYPSSQRSSHLQTYTAVLFAVSANFLLSLIASFF